MASSPTSPAETSKIPRVFLATLGLATALFCALVLLRRITLWVPGQFVYGGRSGLDWSFLLLAVLCGAGVFLLAKRLETASWKRRAGLGSAVWALLLLGTLALRCAEPGGLARLVIVTLSPASGGYYYAAFDSRFQTNWLDSYGKLMRDHHHVATHPPGGVALMRGIRAATVASPALVESADSLLRLSSGTAVVQLQTLARRVWKRDYERADIAAAFWSGFLLLGVAAALPLVISAWTRTLFEPRAASLALLLAMLIPAWGLLAPVLDALITGFGALALFAASRALQLSQQPPESPKSVLRWWFGAGLIAGIGLIFSFALSIVAFIAGVMAIFAACKNESGRRFQTRDFGLSISSLTLGFALPIALYALMGVDWPSIFKLTRQLQNETMIQYNRPYRTWIWFNLFDFFTFLGLPVTFLLLRGVWKQRGLQWALGISALGTLLFLNFAANVSAESSRIWMFFMPPLLIAAAASWAQETESENSAILILGAQALQFLALFVALDVWSL